MEHDKYLGKLVQGRIAAGTVRPGDPIVALDREGKRLEEGKVTRLFTRRGMTPHPLEAATAGDIVQIAGLQLPTPTCTIAAPAVLRPLYADPLDPPTLSMCFGVNDSPLGGREGSLLTSSAIADRLAKEAMTNVALQVRWGSLRAFIPWMNSPPFAVQVSVGSSIEGMSDAMEVRGRGELQMSILIENSAWRQRGGGCGGFQNGCASPPFSSYSAPRGL